MGSINPPLRALEPCPFIQRLQSPITESCGGVRRKVDSMGLSAFPEENPKRATRL